MIFFCKLYRDLICMFNFTVSEFRLLPFCQPMLMCCEEKFPSCILYIVLDYRILSYILVARCVLGKF